MRSVIAVVVGLLMGIAVAVGAAAAVYTFIPARPVAVASVPPLTAPPSTPTPPPPTLAPTPTPVASPGASGSPLASPMPSSAFRLVGGAAPALVAPRVGGGTVDLAALRGKPVWVVFTATTSPACRDEYPLMNGFAARYEEAGLVIVAIHVKEQEATVAAFVEDLGVTFPVGLDADGSLARTWDAAALPVHYWIDASGTVRDAALGGLGPQAMESGVSSIVPGSAAP